MRSRNVVKMLGITLALLTIIFLKGLACYETCKTSAAISTSLPSAAAEPVVTSNDPVSEWNQSAVVLALLPASQLQPIQQSRAMAIVQVSVHDAVNGITGRYETYLPHGPAPGGASPEAAAIAAAYQSLSGLFGNGPYPALGNKTLDELFAESLSSRGLSGTDPGIAFGIGEANAILALRSSDGSAQAQFPYNGRSTDPGVWRLLPGQTASLPGWGSVTPFVINSSSQFRPDAPPAMGSDLYAQGYNEIKAIGNSTSATRTPLQTQIANFWRGSPTAIWNPVMTQVIAARDLDLSDTARSYALMYLAAGDASIACWEAKYYYNSWRPQSAIRRGDEDGNAATTPDPTWLPLLPTPPHPEYPSGHTDNSSAMAHILNSLFGRDPGMTLSVTLSGITRQWSTFDEAVDEVIDARVYSGIHFRNSDEVGAKQGRQVAQFVLTHTLRPCRGHGSGCS